MAFKRFDFILIIAFLSVVYTSICYAEDNLSLSDFSIQKSYEGTVNHREETKKLSPNLVHEYLNAKKVNFAGHYVLFTYGSGGGSLGYGLLDAQSGLLIENDIPNYLVDELDEDLFSINSALVIIKGRGVEDENKTRKYFLLKDGLLHLIRTSDVSTEG